MTHYVCPVCKGVSDHPKVCETEGCAREGQDLVECNCEDGLHAGVAETAEGGELAAAPQVY